VQLAAALQPYLPSNTGDAAASGAAGGAMGGIIGDMLRGG